MENDIDDNDDLFLLQGFNEGLQKLMPHLAEIGLAIIRDAHCTVWLTNTETAIDRILNLTTNFYKREIEHTQDGILFWLEDVRDGEIDLPKIK